MHARRCGAEVEVDLGVNVKIFRGEEMVAIGCDKQRGLPVVATLLFAILAVVVAGCGAEGNQTGEEPSKAMDSVGFCQGDALFGRPTPNTGLSDEECRPDCPDCDDGPFAPPAYDEAFIDELRAWRLIDPPSVLEGNPYDESQSWPLDEESVCAVRIVDSEERTYRLETWSSADEAADEGAIMTHEGACGLCSDLESLALYAGVGDLTQPVRECGIVGMVHGGERGRQCLKEIGFNEHCADIWYWNTVNTREHCQSICMELFSEPYHHPDGTLNDCLQCDEDISGPVFKAVAGRTRRNSGLATALCRPCDEVRPLRHQYHLPDH
jgi:hypothetical protein